MFDPTKHIIERHLGKAAIITENGSITVNIECTLCGQLTIGPLPLAHLASTIQMLQHIASESEVNYESRAKIVEMGDDSDIEAGMRQYANMPVDPRESGYFTDSPPHKDEDPWSS